MVNLGVVSTKVTHLPCNLDYSTTLSPSFFKKNLTVGSLSYYFLSLVCSCFSRLSNCLLLNQKSK